VVHRTLTLIEVGGDDSGLYVAVTHRTTGRRLFARPDLSCGVASTQERLERQVVAEFFVPDDYQLETGRCGDGERYGTFYRVAHLPTGRSRRMDSLTNADTRQAHARLLDALVEELWHDGLLAHPTKPAEPCAAADRGLYRE